MGIKSEVKTMEPQSMEKPDSTNIIINCINNYGTNIIVCYKDVHVNLHNILAIILHTV